MTHELKCVNPYFSEVFCGLKTFEVRKNDRDFQLDDNIILKEYENEQYTGDEVYATITYILPGGQFGIEPGYVVMGIYVLET
ncbi:MAG TPA: DUF3850 domain-containing protein, partial [Saprospiraceae bacterium]|nr:DUF3850 domain-containing protein [Saprospiraceae bacterium]